MTPAEVLRILQTIRYSPRAGRPVSFAWIGRQAGFHGKSLHRAIRRGRFTPDMARRLAPVLARIALASATIDQGDIANTLGQLGGGTARLPVGRALPRAPARPGGSTHELPKADDNKKTPMKSKGLT